MKKTLLVSTIVVIVLLIFSARPSQAFDVELELLYLEPTNMDLTYVHGDVLSSPAPPAYDIKMYTVDHPYAPAYRLTLGHQGWKVSYLSFSDSEKDSVTSTDAANDLYVTTGHPWLSPEWCDRCTVRADSEIRFRMLSFYRDTPLAQSGSFTANYRLGLRYVSIEHDVEALMDWTDPTLSDFKDVYNLDTSAFGFTAGVNGLWALNNSLDLGFDLGLSLLYGSTDGKYKFIMIDPSTGACSTASSCWTWKWDKDTIVPMMDMALRLTYSVMKNMDVFAAYNMMYLINAGSMQEFVDNVQGGRAVETNESLGFNGPSFGVRYLIGG